MVKKSLFIFTLVLLLVLFSGCTNSEPKDETEAVSKPDILEPVKEAKEAARQVEEAAEEVAEEAERIESETEAEEDEFDRAPMVSLEDVAGGDATGRAWLAYKDGKTIHKVEAFDMPELEGGDFYEGWLVKGGDFFSTGRMEYDEGLDGFILNYETDGDKTSYTEVVITLEPDDGDPAPAKHVIENSFPSGVDYNLD